MGKIIVMYKDEDKELNMSLYDYVDMQYRNAVPIMVCHVTEEEYSNMKDQIKLGCLNERLPRITSEKQRGYNKFRYVITYDTKEGNLLVSDYENPQKIGSYTIDSEGIHYHEKGYQITNNPDQFRFVHRLTIYTTESYEQIIAHYEEKQNRDYQIQEKTKELIALIGKRCATCNTECCGGLTDERAQKCNKWSYNIH